MPNNNEVIEQQIKNEKIDHQKKIVKESTESIDDQKKDIVLVGNPNVGKSVVFSHLTNTYVVVSNYPGTTVEVASGKSSMDGHDANIVDTPGVNNLIPMSEDEIVTRNILLQEEPKTVVQVADGKNLRRSLFITLQLIEMGISTVLDINMVDEAKARGIRIDSDKLAQHLDIPVAQTVAIRKTGMSHLVNLINDHPGTSTYRFNYSEEIEKAINQLEELLPETAISKRSIALMLISKDTSLNDWLFAQIAPEHIHKINQICEELQNKFNSPLGYIITQQRMNHIRQILADVLQEEKHIKTRISRHLDHLTMHPVWGFGVVLLVLFFMYEFVGVFGAGTLVDVIEEKLFGTWIIPSVTKFIQWLFPWAIIQEFLVGEYGLISIAITYAVAIVLPIVTTFFIAFAILEDSGYLPRLSIIVNRLFRTMGLNGKAVLPMVLGLGCDTMATLTTRILDSPKERIIVTLLLALGIPCSAQLGVILGMLGGISPIALVIWAGTVLVILFLVGYLSSKIIPGKNSDFIMELPPLRVPGFTNIISKTLARIEWYLKEAVPLFMLGTLVLFTFDKLHLLRIIQKAAAPVVQGFLQLPPKATEAFLIGFLRRDYGVAGLFTMAQSGELSTVQIVVSLITITLFVPCIANFFIIIKERGWKIALVIVGFIIPFAFLVGGIMNFLLRFVGFGS